MQKSSTLPSPLIFLDTTNSSKHAYSLPNWVIPETTFLGSMLSLSSWSTTCFLTRSIGSNILHHLRCHLLPLPYTPTSKSNFSFPSINLLLLLLNRWQLQYFEHLLCLEPIIPTILSLKSFSAFVIHTNPSRPTPLTPTYSVQLQHSADTINSRLTRFFTEKDYPDRKNNSTSLQKWPSSDIW